jgi:hypothetical protein
LRERKERGKERLKRNNVRTKEWKKEAIKTAG